MQCTTVKHACRNHAAAHHTMCCSVVCTHTVSLLGIESGFVLKANGMPLVWCRGRLQLAQDTLATLCSNPMLATDGLLSFVQVCTGTGACIIRSSWSTSVHSVSQSQAVHLPVAKLEHTQSLIHQASFVVFASSARVMGGIEGQI